MSIALKYWAFDQDGWGQVTDPIPPQPEEGVGRSDSGPEFVRFTGVPSPRPQKIIIDISQPSVGNLSTYVSSVGYGRERNLNIALSLHTALTSIVQVLDKIQEQIHYFTRFDSLADGLASLLLCTIPEYSVNQEVQTSESHWASDNHVSVGYRLAVGIEESHSTSRVVFGERKESLAVSLEIANLLQETVSFINEYRHIMKVYHEINNQCLNVESTMSNQDGEFEVGGDRAEESSS